MRNPPRFCRFIPVLAFASLLAGAGTDAFAQGAVKENPPAGRSAAPSPSPSYDLAIKDGMLTWNGSDREDNARSLPAYLGNVVDLLRELHPEANIVVSPGLEGILIADLKMRASTVEEKLEAIRVAGGSQFLWRAMARNNLNPDTTLYVLDALPPTAKPGLQVEAFHLGEHFTYVYGSHALSTNNDARQKLIEEQIDRIQQLVRETVDEYRTIDHALNNAKTKSLPAPSIRFHRGANLVVIIGEPETVAIAAKVIGALPGTQRSKANPGLNEDPDRKLDEVIKRLQRDATAAPRP